MADKIFAYGSVDRCLGCGYDRETRNFINIKEKYLEDEKLLQITCKNCGYKWKERCPPPPPPEPAGEEYGAGDGVVALFAILALILFVILLSLGVLKPKSAVGKKDDPGKHLGELQEQYYRTEERYLRELDRRPPPPASTRKPDSTEVK